MAASGRSRSVHCRLQAACRDVKTKYCEKKQMLNRSLTAEAPLYNGVVVFYSCFKLFPFPMSHTRPKSGNNTKRITICANALYNRSDDG